MKDNKSANLLFLYGPSGSGKTRLLKLITESLCGVESVMMVGSEQIVDEMARAVTNRSCAKFVEGYTHITNLLIDNIWILRTRPSAAKEMGRLTKARMDQGNLTVLASDLLYEDVIRALPAIGDCLKQKSVTHLNMTLQAFPLL